MHMYVHICCHNHPMHGSEPAMAAFPIPTHTVLKGNASSQGPAPILLVDGTHPITTSAPTPAPPPQSNTRGTSLGGALRACAIGLRDDDPIPNPAAGRARRPEAERPRPAVGEEPPRQPHNGQADTGFHAGSGGTRSASCSCQQPNRLESAQRHVWGGSVAHLMALRATDTPRAAIDFSPASPSLRRRLIDEAANGRFPFLSQGSKRILSLRWWALRRGEEESPGSGCLPARKVGGNRQGGSA